MTIERVVDAHVHLWDPARRRLVSVPRRHAGARHGRHLRHVPPLRPADLLLGSGQVERAEVRARGGGGAAKLVDETRELDAQADATGHPDVLIGGLDPNEDLAELERQLDEQITSKRFRGIRIMGEGDQAIPTPAMLQALQDRGLIFELMVHPDALAPAAAALAGWELPVVVEHTGWPRSNEPEEYELWKTGMAALAGLRENVACKLSGPRDADAVDGGRDVRAVDPRTRSSSSAPTGACSRATSPSTACTGPTTTCTAPTTSSPPISTRRRATQLFAGNAERVYGL